MKAARGTTPPQKGADQKGENKMNNLTIMHNEKEYQVSIVNDGEGTLHLQVWRDDEGSVEMELDAKQNFDIGSMVSDLLDQAAYSEEIIRRGKVGRKGSIVKRLDEIYNELDYMGAYGKRSDQEYIDELIAMRNQLHIELHRTGQGVKQC